MCTSKNIFIPNDRVFGHVVYLTEIKDGHTLYLQKDFFFFFKPEVNKTAAINHYFAVESKVNKVTIKLRH